nr:MAG TPA: hypothetical protein [Caudoviricetes sp.]
MSKVIRSTGTNVTASDDAYILSKLFDDGLFSIPNITISGNKLHITSFRGVVAGRDFQVDEQDVNATMGAGRNATQFKIYVDINLGNSDKIRIVTSQTTPTGANNNDILGSTHFYLELGSYAATNISITNATITAKTAKNIVTKDNLVVPGKVYANSGLVIGGNDTFIVKRFGGSGARSTFNATVNDREDVRINITVPAGYKLVGLLQPYTDYRSTVSLYNFTNNIVYCTVYNPSGWPNVPIGASVDILFVKSV